MGSSRAGSSRSPGVERVIGVDVIPPAQDIGGVEFVRADIRNPMIARVIESAGVDTVVHMNVIATPTFVGGRTPQKEINVIGTMQLLAACQKSSTVRRLVVKSSAAVYGSTPRDPALFTEDMGAKRGPSGGFGKDSIEVEGYVRGFARRRPDTDILTLRFANIIGPRIRTSITDYFNLPVIPAPLGFDARMQFMHEDDAIDALVVATTGDDHRRGQPRRRRRHHRAAGRGDRRAARRCRCRCSRPPVRRRARQAAAPGRLLPRPDVASSPSAAGSTPPGCASCSASPRSGRPAAPSRTSPAPSARPCPPRPSSATSWAASPAPRARPSCAPSARAGAG